MNGTVENSVVHMDALVKMVNMRGGLENLGMHGILKRMVLWYVTVVFLWLWL